jgi:hypothetical protein
MLMLLPALLLAGQSATVHHARTNQPVVQVGLFSYHADGTAAGSAFGTTERLESTVFASASLCQLGAGFRELPAMAAHAWRFAGRVVSANAESAIVELEWQRIMNDGAEVSEAPTSVQLTLKAGDRVLLDSVAPQAKRGCSVTDAGFEARYVVRSAGLSHQFTPVGRGGGIGTGAGIGGGGGVGKGGGTGLGRGTDGGVGASPGGGGGSAYGTRVLVQGESPDPESLKVELWLVHSAPGMTEDQTTYQALTAAREGAMFAFAPVSLTTPEGSIGVQITGSFAVQSGPSGDRLVFQTNRRLTSWSTAGQSGGRAQEAEGIGRIVRAMPGPDDVLSFELPPLGAERGHSAVPDRFSIRVRIRPAGVEKKE